MERATDVEASGSIGFPVYRWRDMFLTLIFSNTK